MLGSTIGHNRGVGGGSRGREECREDDREGGSGNGERREALLGV